MVSSDDPDQPTLKQSYLLMVRFDDVEDVVEVGDEVEVSISFDGKARQQATVTGIDHDLAYLSLPSTDYYQQAAVYTPDGAELPTAMSNWHPIAGDEQSIEREQKPSPSTVETRVSVHDAPPAGDAVAGRPERGTIPMNEVSQRYLSHYVEPNVPLEPQANGVWPRGTMLVYETHWEPLGWALEDWIDTFEIAPYEHRIESSAEISATGTTTQDSKTESRSARRDSANSLSTTNEAMELGTNTSSSTRGVNLGFGGNDSATSAITVDPVLALTRAVTGAFQLGYSGAKTGSETDLASTLTKELATRLEQATAQLQTGQTRALSDIRNDLHDGRTLRALQNSLPNRTLNLALFSLSRQWLVTTQLTRRRPLIFIPIDRRDEEFTAADVFEYRSLLTGVLLEPELQSALERTAASFDPALSAVDGTTPVISRVTGSISFLEQPERGTKVTISAMFGVNGKHTQLATQEIPSGSIRAGQKYAIDLHFDEQQGLSSFEGVVLHYHNPRLKRVKEVTVTSLELLLQPTLTPMSSPAIILPHSTDMQVWYPDALDPTAVRETRRLLSHLNRNLDFYRLAIDLQRDSASRFARLTQRHAHSCAKTAEEHEVEGCDRPIPTDLRAVGVAGVHIAFVLDEEPDADEPKPAERSIDSEPIKKLLSTPAGGTFLEAIAGNREAGVVPAGWPDKDDMPKVVAAANQAYGWPSPYQPTSPAVTPPSAGSSVPLSEASAAVAETSDLVAAAKALLEVATAAATPPDLDIPDVQAKAASTK